MALVAKYWKTVSRQTPVGPEDEINIIRDILRKRIQEPEILSCAVSKQMVDVSTLRMKLSQKLKKQPAKGVLLIPPSHKRPSSIFREKK